MFGSEVLEVAVGLIFLFLLLSLIATTLREAIESVMRTRAVQLERGLRELLDDKDGAITKQLFDHPLLYGLFPGDYDPATHHVRFRLPWRHGKGGDSAPKRVRFASNLPAYIPSRNFALALLHLASARSSGEGDPVMSLAAVRATADKLGNERLRAALLVAVGEAQGSIDRARLSLEAWFDSTMDRVSGWYKRETQWILITIGLFLAIALNVDAVHVAKELAARQTLRQAVLVQLEATQAQLEASTKAPAALRRRADELSGQLDRFSTVLGWNEMRRMVNVDLARQAVMVKAGHRRPDQMWSEGWFWFAQILFAVPGWIVTALAVSLGAPFWFDMLNKVMVIRSTVKPYEKSPNEGSEDRRGGGRPPAQILDERPKSEG